VLELLGVLFVALKLMGKIDWSWWYVTMPFYADILVEFVFFVCWGIINIGISLIHISTKKKK